MVTRIMILTSDTGGGHRASAEALRDGFRELYGDRVAIDMVDLWIEHTPPPINKIPKAYRFLINDAPWLFRLIYEVGDRPQILSPALRVTSRFLGPFVEQAIREYDPDLIVSVHPIMQDIPIRVLRRMRRNVPFATVVTDLVTIPAVWFDKKVTRCFVPSDEGYRLARQYGLGEDQLVQHGLPIRPIFGKPLPPREHLRAALDMQPHVPTVLIVSGGEGMGPVDDIALAIAHRLAQDGAQPRLNTGKQAARENYAPSPHNRCIGQVVVICGRNQHLEDRLRAQRWPVPTLIRGFVDNIWEYMGAADCIVTKAGPGTIFEAAALGLPIILSGYVRGQETGNVPYVLKHGLGVYTEEPAHIAEIIHGWFTDDRPVMDQFAANARRIARPQATFNICRDIVALLDDPPHPIAEETTRGHSSDKPLAGE